MSSKEWVGKEFGNLTVIREDGSTITGKQRIYYVICRCSCGSELRVRKGALSSGNTKSCGCYRVKTSTRLATKHGLANHPAYTSYNAARNRCLNSNSTRFDRYGGRGIEFRFDSFDQLWEHLGQSWFKGATLERINNDGHYELNNVRWATRAEQCRNTSRSVKLTHNGKTQNLKDWANELGLNSSSLSERIQKWGVERALSTPRRFPNESF